MNVDRGKTSFSPEEISAQQVRLMEFKATNGFSWANLGRLTGVPHGTLSQWGPGTYKGDNAAVAERIHKYFLKDEAQRLMFEDAPLVPGFQPTLTSRRIITCLRWAQRGKMVTIIGDPGTGKTATLDQFAGTTPNVWKTTVTPTASSTNAVLLAILRAMGAVRTGGAGHQLAAMIREKVAQREAVLLIDEAQLLSEGAIEELRGLHDATRVGLVLAGNKDVQHRVERSASGASFAQRHSRVSMRHIAKVEPGDVDTLLDAWGVTDAQERKFLAAIAAAPGGGALRALSHTLELATILAQHADDEERVLHHLQAARAQLAAAPIAA